MEKNIAAIVREDTFTVGVVFGDFNSKEYTYISTFPVKKLDRVIVNTTDGFKLVRVSRVDDFLNIPPNSDLEYKFLAGKFDVEAYDDLCKQNSMIEVAMSKQYKKNIRAAYREKVLENLDPESLALMQEVICGSHPVEQIKVGGTE